MYRIVFSSLLGKKKYNCHLFLSSIFVRRAKLACCFSFLILANQSYDFFAINKAQECHGGGAARKPGIFSKLAPQKLIPNPPGQDGETGSGDGRGGGTMPALSRVLQRDVPINCCLQPKPLHQHGHFCVFFLSCLHSQYGHTGFLFFLIVFVQLSRPFSLCFSKSCGLLFCFFL